MFGSRVIAEASVNLWYCIHFRHPIRTASTLLAVRGGGVHLYKTLCSGVLIGGLTLTYKQYIAKDV